MSQDELSDFLLEHIRQSWKDGDCLSAHVYLHHFPRIAADADAAAELIYLHFILQEPAEGSVEFGKFVEEFSEYERELELLRSADQLMHPQFVRAGNRELGSIGDYELIDVIAKGGMGIVYKARQVSLDRIVALKMIRNDALASQEEFDRFRTEAKAAGALQHPNIVAVFEVGEHEQKPFLSMEYFEGLTLRQRIRENILTPKQAGEYAKTIAEAVEYAHHHNILHRDLKPSNVLLNSDGQLKITDFGLAKRIDDDSDLTRTGQIMGTPSYMPPEQAAGRWEEVGPPADVYSIGATLYEMVTGRPPFLADTAVNIISQVLNSEAMAPHILNRKLPTDLDTICLKCLEKLPAKRYPTAAALAEDLGRFLSGEPIKARRTSRVEKAWRWCRRKPWQALATAVSVVALIAAVSTLWYRDRLDLAEENLVLTKNNLGLAEKNLGLARDNEVIQQYYSLTSKTQAQILEPRFPATWIESALSDIDTAARLDTSVRDPAELRTLVADCLNGIDLNLHTTVAKNVNARVLAFSPDGKRLAVGKRRGLPVASVHLFSVPGGEQLHVYSAVHVGLHQSRFGVKSLTFGPDGKWLAAGTRNGWIHVWDTGTQKLKRKWTAHKGNVSSLKFSPDGKYLISCSPDKSVKVWNTADWTMLESMSFETAVTGLDVHPSARWILCGSDDQVTAHALPNLKQIKQVYKDESDSKHHEVRISPDGSFIAYSRDNDIFIDYADAGMPVYRLRSLRDPALETAHTQAVTHLSFCANGSLLVSSSNDQSIKLWELAPGPNGRFLTSMYLGGGGDVFPEFSPNENLLACAADRETKLFKMGGNWERTTEAQGAYTIEAIDYSAGRSGEPDRLACASDRKDGVTAEVWAVGESKIERRHTTFVPYGSTHLSTQFGIV